MLFCIKSALTDKTLIGIGTITITFTLVAKEIFVNTFGVQLKGMKKNHFDPVLFEFCL